MNTGVTGRTRPAYIHTTHMSTTWQQSKATGRYYICEGVDPKTSLVPRGVCVFYNMPKVAEYYLSMFQADLRQ